MLAHILRLVTEPIAKQHPDIGKLGLTVTRLEEIAAETLSAFFMSNEANARKRRYLTEIFTVARQEEHYKNGNIDGSTEIDIMAEETVPRSYISCDDGAALFAKKDEDVEPTVQSRTAMWNAMRPRLSVRTDAATPSGLLGGAFTGQLQMRGSRFQLPMTLQRSFVDVTIQGRGQAATGSYLIPDYTPSPPEANEGPSVFGEFANPGGNDLYPQQWQASSNVATNLPWYVCARQQQNMEPYMSLSPGMPVEQSTAYDLFALQDKDTTLE